MNDVYIYNVCQHMPTSSHIQLSTSTIICHHLPTNISKATFLVDSHRPPGPRCCWTSRARSGRGRGARGARGRGRGPCRCASRGAPSLAWWPSQRLPGAMGGMAEGNWREMEGNFSSTVPKWLVLLCITLVLACICLYYCILTIS